MSRDDRRMKEWIDRIKTGGMPDALSSREEVPHESREYRQYQEEERHARETTWYERIVARTAFFRYDFEDMEEEHRNALRLLDYDIDADQVVPSSIVVMLFFVPFAYFVLTSSLPTLFKLIGGIIPLGAFYYWVKLPALRAKRKLIQSSEDLILSVLYMAIYMTSVPSLDSAVSFAARHLDGPIGKDFSQILWDVDVQKYHNVREGLDAYSERWKPYNKGFTEALNLLDSATHEASMERRNELLEEAIDYLLTFTKERMGDFAQNLKLPVMALHGLGILLPVLGIILFPMIAAFMGGEGMAFYLALLYNIVIPAMVFFLMRTLLVGRPMSFGSASGQTTPESAGKLSVEVGSQEYLVPVYILSVPLFLLMAWWPATHYYSAFFGTGTIPVAPDAVTMLREMMMVLALAIPPGIHLYLGYKDEVARQKYIRQTEEEFPEVLYELGNTLSRGEPIERAVATAAEERKTLNISDMFSIISQNIRQSGMTFEQAVFDRNVGAVQKYASKLIRTIMEIVSESVRKGPAIASDSIMSISNYLKNIHDTQQRLETLLEDTLSSVKFLGFILAPVISGIAVGMGSVISLAFFTISQTFSNRSLGNATAGGGAGGGLGGGQATELFGFLNLESIIPPGILQLIVGVYLIQVSIIVGILYVYLEDGPNKLRRNLAIGKILITSLPIYLVVVFILVIVFGGIIRGVGV